MSGINITPQDGTKGLGIPFILGGAATTTVSVLGAMSVIVIGFAANAIPIVGVIIGLAMMLFGSYFLYQNCNKNFLNGSLIKY